MVPITVLKRKLLYSINRFVGRPAITGSVSWGAMPLQQLDGQPVLLRGFTLPATCSFHMYVVYSALYTVYYAPEKYIQFFGSSRCVHFFLPDFFVNWPFL